MRQKYAPKLIQFCQEYIIDLNGTQAALRAGYAPKAARSQATRLLAMPEVKDRVKELIDERTERAKITQDMVVKELWSIATDSFKNYVTITPHAVTNPQTGEATEKNIHVLTIKNMDEIDPRNVAEVAVNKHGQFKFRLYSRHDALLQLGKHLGMFTEKKKDPADDDDYPGTVPTIIFPRAHNNPPNEAY